MFEHLRKVTDRDELDGLLTSSSTSYRSGLLASGMSTVKCPHEAAHALFFQAADGQNIAVQG